MAESVDVDVVFDRDFDAVVHVGVDASVELLFFIDDDVDDGVVMKSVRMGAPGRPWL